MNSLEKAEKVAEVAELEMKGHSKASIAKQLNISTKDVDSYLREWGEYIADRAAKDPDLLDRYLENILSYKEKLGLISKEAWDVSKLADEHGAMGTKLQALRLAKDLAELEARAFQLMSNRMESGYIERMKKVERVNGILSAIIKEVVGDCPRCSEMAWRRLEEMWRLQGDEAPSELIPIEEGETDEATV